MSEDANGSTVVFGVCVGPSDRFDRICLPSIRRHCPDADILIRRNQPSIPTAYNSIAAEALESNAAAVILIHDDVELRADPRPRIKACFETDADAAVIGVVGSTGAQFHWWPDGQPQGYAEDTRQTFDFGGGTHAVDVVDGLFLAMSPWAMTELRFDDAVGAWHGYDSDICWQVRARGKRVLVTDVRLFHHARALQGYDLTPFEQARARFLLKWHPEASRTRRGIWRVQTTRRGQGLVRRSRKLLDELTRKRVSH